MRKLVKPNVLTRYILNGFRAIHENVYINEKRTITMINIEDTIRLLRRKRAVNTILIAKRKVKIKSRISNLSLGIHYIYRIRYINIVNKVKC